MKRIGVIGGMGQLATLDILSRIFKAAVAYSVPQYGNRGYPPLDIRMINQAPMNLNSDGSYPDLLEPSSALLEAAKFVGKDADFMIVASNTAHVFTSEIEQAASKPLLSLVNVAIDEAIRRGCKRVGVLAIGITLREKLFQKPLETAGIESILLPDSLKSRLENEAIYPLQEGADPKELSKPALAALAYFVDQNVDAIILGCTEIPILLGSRADGDGIINPSQLLAEAAVRKSLQA